MTPSALSLTTIAAVTLKSLMYRLLFPRTQSVQFPRMLEGYRFFKTLDASTSRTSARGVAIYKEKRTGKLTILKTWSGRAPDLSWLQLAHEIELNRQVHSIESTTMESFNEDKLRVVVPRMIWSSVSKHTVMLLTEFVAGTPLSTLSSTEQIRLFVAATTYIQIIGERLEDLKTSRLPTRSNRRLIALFPFLFLVAMVRAPFARRDLLRGAWDFATCIPALLRRRTTTLVHRDLHSENILKTDQGIAVLDFQLCVRADPLLEFGSSLRFYWDDPLARKLLLTAMRRRFGHEPEFNRAKQAFCVYAATHALTAPESFPMDDRRKFHRYLEGAIRR